VYQVAAWALFALCELISVIGAERGAEVPYFQNPLVRCSLVLLILTPPLILDALRFAHRLVGPLYRFRKTIQAIATGEEVEPVKLRKGDLLLDFQDDFNAMLRYLEHQGYVVLKRPAAGGEQPQTEGLVAPAAVHQEV
jgi:hypothetical protein